MLKVRLQAGIARARPAVCPRRLKKPRCPSVKASRGTPASAGGPPSRRGSTSKRSRIPSNARRSSPRRCLATRWRLGGERAAIAAPRRARSFSPFSKISPPSDRPLTLAHLPIDAGRAQAPLRTRRGRDQERRGVQAALEDHPHLPRPQRCVPPAQIRRPPSTRESTRLRLVPIVQLLYLNSSHRPRSPRTPDRHEQDGDQPPGPALRHLGRRGDRARARRWRTPPRGSW